MTGAAMMMTGALRGPITLSASWSSIGYAAPTTFATNEDRTLTFNGPARTINLSHSLVNTLNYRINSGSWTSGVSFSISSGQTLGFRVSGNSNESFTTVTVQDGSRGNATIGTFGAVVAGF